MNPEITVPLSKFHRGEKAYWRAKRCNLNSMVDFTVLPNLFLTFSVDEKCNPDLAGFINQFYTIDFKSDVPIQIQAPFLSTMYNYVFKYIT